MGWKVSAWSRLKDADRVARFENFFEKSARRFALEIEAVADTARNVEEQRKLDRSFARLAQSLNLLRRAFFFELKIFGSQVSDGIALSVRDRNGTATRFELMRIGSASGSGVGFFSGGFCESCLGC